MDTFSHASATNGTISDDQVIQDIKLSYNVTSLRRDPTYITFYVNWFLLLSTGILPMSALVFLNSKIYAKILGKSQLEHIVCLGLAKNVPEKIICSSPNALKVNFTLLHIQKLEDFERNVASKPQVYWLCNSKELVTHSRATKTKPLALLQ